MSLDGESHMVFYVVEPKQYDSYVFSTGPEVLEREIDFQ